MLYEAILVASQFLLALGLSLQKKVLADISPMNFAVLAGTMIAVLSIPVALYLGATNKELFTAANVSKIGLPVVITLLGNLLLIYALSKLNLSSFSIMSVGTFLLFMLIFSFVIFKEAQVLSVRYLIAGVLALAALALVS